MTHMWHINYVLAIICPLALCLWVIWLFRRPSDWSAKVALKYHAIFLCLLLFGICYHTIADTRLLREVITFDISNPHLIQLIDNHSPDEIGIPGKGMLAIGGLYPPQFNLAEQVVFPHQPQHLLVVYQPPFLL